MPCRFSIVFTGPDPLRVERSRVKVQCTGPDPGKRSASRGDLTSLQMIQVSRVGSLDYSVLKGNRSGYYW